MTKKIAKKAVVKKPVEPKKMMNGREVEKGGHITYQTDGKGNWWKRVSAIRCDNEIFLHGQCQGVDAHMGLHWCYSECGSFCWGDNEYDPKEGGCSGMTPPEHKTYQSPQEMMKHYHGNLGGEYVKVEDADEIVKLEADEMFGEGVAIISPVTNKKSIARLKKIKQKNAITAKKFMKGKPRLTIKHFWGTELIPPPGLLGGHGSDVTEAYPDDK